MNSTGSFVPIWSCTVPETQIPPRLCKSLQAGRDVYPIPKKIVALNDDVADVDADAEMHLLNGRSIRILLAYGVLNFDCAFHGIHGTGEIGKHAIASRVEDPTAMRGDQVIDDDPVCCEVAKSADLISPHQEAVRLDIGCEDRRELSFDPVSFQGSAPPNPEYSEFGREIRGPVNHSEARW